MDLYDWMYKKLLHNQEFNRLLDWENHTVGEDHICIFVIEKEKVHFQF